LFVRWFQFGAFCPVFRAHGQTTEREPWYFGGPEHPAYRTLLRFAELRYRLLPYVYSLAARVTLDHDTLMRALVMDFPEDPKAREISDQFLFGPALLVSPVTAPRVRSRPAPAVSRGHYRSARSRWCSSGPAAPCPMEPGTERSSGTRDARSSSAPEPAGSVLGREVAELVADVDVQVGGRAHHHASPAAVVRGVVGDVAQPILRAQLLGETVVDAVELRHVLQEMGLASGGPPERREEERRLVGVERPRGGGRLGAAKADAVDTDPRALGEIEDLLVGDGGSGVLAVAEDHHRPAPQLGLPVTAV